jgi:hypothetical protein
MKIVQLATILHIEISCTVYCIGIHMHIKHPAKSEGTGLCWSLAWVECEAVRQSGACAGGRRDSIGSGVGGGIF